MHSVSAFFFVMLFLAIGDILSHKTKAFVPALLVFIVLLVAAGWSGILPTDILQTAGFSGELTRMAIIIVVVNMGVSLSLRELIAEWRSVLIGIAAILGVGLTVLTLGAGLFDWQSAVAIAPPISGGLVAAFEMSQAALERGLPALATLVLLTLVLQGLPSYFIVPSLLKIEVKRQLALRGTTGQHTETKSDADAGVKKWLPALPPSYQTSSILLALLALVGFLAVLSGDLSRMLFAALGIEFDISPTIFALLYGVIAGEIGLIERNALQKAGAFGFIITASIVGVVGGLLNASPQDVLQVLPTIAGYIAIALIGLSSLSILTGRLLGKSWAFSFAIGMNCLMGFPINYLLTSEAVKAMTDDEAEREYLMSKLLPSMLVGGFTTVTIGSVIFAGILKHFM